MYSFLLRLRRALLVAALLIGLTPLAVGAGTVIFIAPTDAAVLDPFRLPNGPYGAGNRGIEYDTIAGDVVVAAAAGEVVFSGPVAGNLFVSIDHPGGLRSTYGFVANTLVRVGTHVDAGAAVAGTGGPFHFTVRLDGVYVDPARLFGVRRESVTLVPLAEPPDTLLDGSFEPRTMSPRPRRILLIRASPGRFGVPHEVVTGKKDKPWQSSR